MNNIMEKLFVYGTFLDRQMRKKLLGRDVSKSEVDSLDGFKISSMSDEGFCYPILVKERNSNDFIKGDVIEVTPAEMEIIDKYEGNLSIREEHKLKSGIKAWVYFQPDTN